MEQTEYKIREVCAEDYDALMLLYTHLHEKSVPAMDARIAAVWERILRDPGYHIIAADVSGTIAATCTCIIVPNMTHGVRPYALIENVVTLAEYRRRGLASACLDYAKQLAVRENCYKIMLMTGAKDEGTLHFYEQAGFDRGSKTAFSLWMEDAN